MRQSALLLRPVGLDRSLPILKFHHLLDSVVVLAFYLCNAGAS
jgi:hypothetical protein